MSEYQKDGACHISWMLYNENMCWGLYHHGSILFSQSVREMVEAKIGGDVFKNLLREFVWNGDGDAIIFRRLT